MTEIITQNNDLQAFVKQYAEKMLGMSQEEREEFIESLSYLYENQHTFDINKVLQRNPKYEHVTLRDFVEDKDFLGQKGEIRTKIWPLLEEINSGNYDEAVLTGAIGYGKTTIALVTQAWQLFQLSRYKNPQGLFGLQQSSEIIFIFQNINATLARLVDYERFRDMIIRSPYFKTEFPYDTSVKNTLKLPNRIEVKPVSGSSTAVIGQNVFSGLIDEVNFMDRVDKSLRSADGMEYDQASALYNAISRRRKSRFMRTGQNLPGVLCLGSSKQYPGEFTDKKYAEMQADVELKGFSRIYYCDKRTWDTAEDGTFSDEWFYVFIGDESRQPRILKDGETYAEEDKELILEVPMDYRTEFETDLIDSLRDIGGVSVLSSFPFIWNRQKVNDMFDNNLESILSTSNTNFDDRGLMFHKNRFRNTHRLRWVHVDLGLLSDSAGVACGYVDGFMTVKREGVIERMPHITIDFTLEVEPVRGGEIQFWKIRDLIVKLREHGLPIMWVTYDTWQSADSLQMLAKEGFSTGLVSLDKSVQGYDYAKTAIYENRVSAPYHEKCLHELISLERDREKGKIDHPPNGSKDVSDALAAVIFRLTIARQIWAEHDEAMYRAPDEVIAASRNAKMKYEAEQQEEGDAIRRADLYFTRSA